MNLQALASHTVDLDLLPDAPVVLDAGCRWFDFTAAILTARQRAQVICMDPSKDVKIQACDNEGADWVYPPRSFCLFDNAPGAFYRRAALVGSGDARQHLAHFSTGEGDYLTTPRHMPGWDIQPEFYEVDCMTIGELMLVESVSHWDLVKLDIEGSEFDVLEHWPGPIATQLSVEFHDWDKPRYRADTYYDRLWKLLPWYRAVQHQFSKQGTGVGHWDSLLVLRNA